jgi:two-component system sensor histidine kinase KdpD
LEKYRDLEESCGGLAPLNVLFAERLERLEEMLTRTKYLLRGVIVQRNPVEVIGLLNECLEGVRHNELKSPPLVAALDRVHLLNALTEIVGNSIKFVGRDKLVMEVSAEISTVDAKKIIDIHIRDNGPGVPADQKKLIFDDFYSYDPRNHPGIGLGLSLARRVVEAHGGTIEEAGDPTANGADFHIQLPFVPVEKN